MSIAATTQMPVRGQAVPVELKAEELSEVDFDRLLNPTQEDEQFVYSIKPSAPPSNVMVWLRMIGLPLANAYFKTRRIIRLSWQWVVGRLSKNTNKAFYEESL